MLAASSLDVCSSSRRLICCKLLIRSSCVSSVEMVSAAISRKATTGFLSLSRSTVNGSPDEMPRARCAAVRTRSKRLLIFSMQSSTVTRAISQLHMLRNWFIINLSRKYNSRHHEQTSRASVVYYVSEISNQKQLFRSDILIIKF